jgi:hypothetical protein
MPNSATITAKLAAQRKADLKLKTRVACAWTLANTMLPTGTPEAHRFKFAENLLKNSTPTLKAMTRQAAVNAYHSKLAETRDSVHKEELNDLMESPSDLAKEKSALESELKGDAKSAKLACDDSCKGDCDHKKEARKAAAAKRVAAARRVASAKKADDTKDAGPQPAEYPEPKRDEPEDLDGSNAAKRDESTIDKSAKRKKAEEEVPVAEEKTEEVVEDGEPVAEEAVAETEEVPVEGVTEEPAAEAEFDAEEVKLEDAIEETKDAIDNLQEALDEKEGEEDIILPEGEGEGDFTEEDFDEEIVGDDEFIDDEFDVTKAFDVDAMQEKVSSLANEDGVEAAFDGDTELMAEEMGEDFFGPSDPAELEGLLDQEESLASPADMFAGDNIEDPMAALFHTSSNRTKRAAAEGDIVKPGELDSFFESEIAGGDDRDAETDHEDDILDEVLDKVKPVEQGSVRTPQDSEPKLEEPKNATKKKATLKLRPRDPSKVAAAASHLSIVGALFGDD